MLTHREQDGADVFELAPARAECKAAEEVFAYVGAQYASGASIGRIVSSRYSVRTDTDVDDIVDGFNSVSSLLAIGVVNDRNEPVGVIIRRELFNLLGKSFGRGLIERATAGKVMKECRSFRSDMLIFAVSEAVSAEMTDGEIRYFTAISSDGLYAGVFSTRDILVHLANITRKDVEMARLLQSRIVQGSFRHDARRFGVRAFSRMALGVGGDFYSVREYAPGRTHLAVADVSGKGIAASLITAVACGMCGSFDFTAGLTAYIRSINDYLLNTFQSEKYLTGVFMDMDEDRGRITIGDMGHSLVYLVRGSNPKRISLRETNFPVGIAELDKIRTGTLPLIPGDLIFIATDGLTEQTSPEREEFGEERALGIIRELAAYDPARIDHALITALDAFRLDAAQKDDITWMLISWRG